MSPLRRRRPLRFTVKFLLVITTVCGVLLGLYVERAQRQARAVTEILRKQPLSSITYDYEYAPQDAVKPRSRVPDWLLSRTGPDLYHNIVSLHFGGFYAQEIADGPAVAPRLRKILVGLPHLRDLVVGVGPNAGDDCLAAVGELLPKLEHLDCYYATDIGLTHLASLRRLKSLHCWGPNLSDDSLRVLGELPQLENLSLQGTRFTDAGLAKLRNLKHLKHLSLRGAATCFTDAGLVNLEGLPAIETLELQNANVTTAALTQLKRAVPSLRVKHMPPQTIEDIGPDWVRSALDDSRTLSALREETDSSR